MPSFVVEEHVLGSRDCRDDTEHRGNPNCARAGDLTRNSRGSGCGKDPHQIHRSGPAEEGFILTAIRCVSLRISLQVAQSVPLSVSVCVESARMLTHPDDSSTSAPVETQNICTSHQSAEPQKLYRTHVQVQPQSQLAKFSRSTSFSSPSFSLRVVLFGLLLLLVVLHSPSGTALPSWVVLPCSRNANKFNT